jgi:hypothetical protein
MFITIFTEKNVYYYKGAESFIIRRKPFLQPAKMYDASRSKWTYADTTTSWLQRTS